jgi:hypothetical protein
MHVTKKRKLNKNTYKRKSSKVYWKISPTRLDTSYFSDSEADINNYSDSNSDSDSSEESKPESFNSSIEYSTPEATPNTIYSPNQFLLKFVLYLIIPLLLVYFVLTLNPDTRQVLFTKFLKNNMDIIETIYKQYVIRLKVLWYTLNQGNP